MGSKIGSIQATEIAEGQLDPSTMKRFNVLPSSNTQRKPMVFKKPSQQLPIQLRNGILKQERTTDSCFTVVSSQKTGTKRITGKFPIQFCINMVVEYVQQACELT